MNPDARYDPNADAARDGWQATVGGIDLHFGAGVLGKLGTVAGALGGHRALVVTDPGLVAAGHAERARQTLEAAGLEATIYDAVAENPTSAHVDGGLAAARAAEVDILVALGGGSAMDCTKGVNFLLAGGGRIEDYRGFGKARGILLPSIGVPTTAGTGSDAQSFALLARVDDHVKMACGDPQARFRAVLLDPLVLASLPLRVAAVSGLDAISHAVESFVTRRRNPVSHMAAGEAFRRLEGAFERFLDRRDEPQAAGDMLLGAHLAGAAIEASMLGAAHACANPLTAHFGIAHGVAVTLMLPHVVRFNAAARDGASEALYRELVRSAGLNGDGPSASERLATRITALARRSGLPAGLSSLGVAADRLDTLAREAAGQWTARFNPRTTDVASLRRLYRTALEPETMS